MKKIFVVYVLVYFLLGCSSTKTIKQNQLKQADLLFVVAKNQDISAAINRVTKQAEDDNFDHVVLVEHTSEGVYVLHASSKKGTIRESLQEFLVGVQGQRVVVYRVRGFQDENQQKKVIDKAHSMLGLPYNFSYVLDDECLYCSDFIERCFREFAVFEHIPMNFKNPKTGQIDDFWKEFYEKYQIDVPQDKPGTNPNQLSRSEKLEKIGQFSY
ncbi:MAG: YiiX/YebB-like N1pC/P60 family cysteine hydrolase [Bacteroidota bacterium]|nr:YiiX/YebB-like N1pC/P60 family cysteine hydrolase [Bacteroidota bacterium]